MIYSGKIELLIALAMVLTVFGCRDEQRPADKTPAGPTPSTAAAVAGAHDSSATYDSILTALLGIEGSIFSKPTEIKRIPLFLVQSFDTVSGSFLVAGKGVSNPEFPEAAKEAGRKTAALADGKRWALYAKAWRNGDIKPIAHPISGDIAYSKVLFERMNGDTLYELIQVPIGSIVIR